MQASSTELARHPRWAEFVLALGGFGIGTSEFVIMGLMNRVAEDLAVSVPQVGYSISSYALGVVVGAPLISALAARVPKRALLIALMLVFALGNIASAMAPGFWSFVGLRFFSRVAPWGVFWCGGASGRRRGAGRSTGAGHCPRHDGADGGHSNRCAVGHLGG